MTKRIISKRLIDMWERERRGAQKNKQINIDRNIEKVKFFLKRKKKQ